MKKIKFIVAIVAITIATFGNIFNANAKKRPFEDIACRENGLCGTSGTGQSIEGRVINDNEN